MEGFIFINSTGEYAVERTMSGFSSVPQELCWTKDINLATVFNKAKPWSGHMKQYLSDLKRAHPLRAESTRIVIIKPAEDNDE